MSEYADRRGRDVFWMTAEERNELDARAATVSGHLVHCEHGYCETEHCRTCEIMESCMHCEAKKL